MTLISLNTTSSIFEIQFNQESKSPVHLLFSLFKMIYLVTRSPEDALREAPFKFRLNTLTKSVAGAQTQCVQEQYLTHFVPWLFLNIKTVLSIVMA